MIFFPVNFAKASYPSKLKASLMPGAKLRATAKPRSFGEGPKGWVAGCRVAFEIVDAGYIFKKNPWNS